MEVYIMSIWEEIQQELTKAADITLKEAGKLTDTARQKLDEKILTNHIGKLYGEIGRLCYDAHRTGADHSKEIAAVCSKIDNLNEKLANVKAGNSASRIQHYCYMCGSELPIDADTCPKCGEKQFDAEETAETADDGNADDGKDKEPLI